MILSVCLSVRPYSTLCTVAKRYILQQVSEEVNGKCSLAIRRYNFQFRTDSERPKHTRSHYTLWATKRASFYYCNNFIYFQPIFTIFGTYILLDICNKKIIVSPPNTVCATTLPCKILITILFMFTFYILLQKVALFTLVIIVNFRSNFIKNISESITLDYYYFLQVIDRPSFGRGVIAMTANDTSR